MERISLIAILSILISFTIKCSPSNTLNLITLNPSTLAPNLTFITSTPTHIYTLASNNLVQCLRKSDTSIVQFNLTTYIPSANQVDNISISALALNQTDETLLLIAQNNTKPTLFFHTVLNYTVRPSVTVFTFSYLSLNYPNNTFIVNYKACSLYNNRLSPLKDLLFCYYTKTYSYTAYNLSTSAGSLSITPNREKIIVWDSSSRIYVYSVSNNISQLYFYNGSYTTNQWTTQSITFSLDSQLALIETDQWNPLRILNLTDYTIIESITIGSKILSVDFIDASNRYILINCPNNTYIYDRSVSYLFTINSTLVADSVMVDINTSHILTKANNATVWQSYAIVSSVADMPAPQMSYQLNLSEWQNQTFYQIDAASSVIMDVVTKFNLIIFSSPFTCFFLGFLNYFNLNSLYVLLNMRLPTLVFDQISNVYLSANINLFKFLGIDVTVQPFSDELVDGRREMYFLISSDLISSNYYSFGLVCVNIVIFQIILAIKHFIPQASSIHRFLGFKRKEIYFGLALSLMVNIFLPWNFIKNASAQNYPTTINIFFHHLLCYSFVSFLMLHLTSILRKENHNKREMTMKVKSVRKRHKQFKSKCLKFKECKTVKKAVQFNLTTTQIKPKPTFLKDLPDWMIGFQNLIYPLLVTLERPHYFLTIVFISKFLQVKIFLKHSKEKGLNAFLQMVSFICELVYHLTFFVLLYAKDENILIYDCIICLSFFYLGAIINLIQILVFFAAVIKKMLFFSCLKRENRVKNEKAAKPETQKIQQTRQTQLEQNIINPPVVIFDIHDEQISNKSHHPRQKVSFQSLTGLKTRRFYFKPRITEVKKDPKSPNQK